MSSINERVKEVRLHFNLTQIQFGKRICMSQGQLTSVETGKRNVTDRTIKMICSEFDVSEDWLRFGTGDMIIEKRKTEVNELVEKYGYSDTIRQLFECFEQLTPVQQEAVLEYAQRFIASLFEEQSVESKTAAYREELIAEKDTKTSSASQTGSDATA